MHEIETIKYRLISAWKNNSPKYVFDMKKQFLCILTYFRPISESNLQGSIRLKDILLGMEGGRGGICFIEKKIILI